MTILSAQSIRKRSIFTPFSERTRDGGVSYGLGPASYDVRIRETVTLKPGECHLASTIERFDMPLDIAGEVKDKSTWARRFLFVQNTFVDPGWNGFLTLELSNQSSETIVLPSGTPIAQIVLHLLDEPTEQGYSGKYQGQAAEAVSAIFEVADGIYEGTSEGVQRELVQGEQGASAGTESEMAQEQPREEVGAAKAVSSTPWGDVQSEAASQTDGMVLEQSRESTGDIAEGGAQADEAVPTSETSVAP